MSSESTLLKILVGAPRLFERDSASFRTHQTFVTFFLMICGKQTQVKAGELLRYAYALRQIHLSVRLCVVHLLSLATVS